MHIYVCTVMGLRGRPVPRPRFRVLVTGTAVGDALRLALSTFTVVRVPGGRADRRSAGRAVELAPLVGCVVGILAAVVLYVARHVFHDPFGFPMVGATVAIGTLAVLTGGRHLDGLAVTASRTAGSLGAVVVVFLLLLQVGALVVCVNNHRGTESLLLAVLVGRLAVVWACTPAARVVTADEFGALVAGTVRPVVALVLTAAIGAEAAIYGRFDTDAGTVAGSVRGLLAFAAGLTAAELLRRQAVRRLGGLTGHLLGAEVEVATTVVLLVMAASR